MPFSRFAALASSLALLCAILAGCSPLRFVVEATTATDELTETVVLKDAGGGASKVALIDLNGLIVDADIPGLIVPGENPVARFVESLTRAGSDSNVKAVVVRLNSPGGAVTASDTLYREVLRFRESTGKPVVMTMADVAASGAFYVSLAGDEVIASATTITGSIGVIMQTVNFAEGMRKIGISADAITSGPNKAMGSPFEPMPETHRQLLQDMVDEFYGRFRGLVAEQRPDVSPADLEWATDGRIITGDRAAEIGLVHRTGDLHDAFVSAKRLAGLESARLVKYHRPLRHVGSAYAQTPMGDSINLVQVNLAGAGLPLPTGFYYLWLPE